MNRHKNRRTQPFFEHPVFNRWDVVPAGWYHALPSNKLAKGQVKSMVLCGQQVVLFRGDDGTVRCLDAFCSHMGVDLGEGKVVGNTIQCYFHHWRYDGTGACVDVPCGEPIPKNARQHRWATEEKYGFIWVFPAAEAPVPVIDLADLEDKGELTFLHGTPYTRPCHHHVTMINGLDAQHLSTIHGMEIENPSLDATAAEDGHTFTFELRWKIPGKTLRQRFVQFMLGKTYAYGMRYGFGNLGGLSLAKRTRLFGRWPFIGFHMFFSYRPVDEHRCEVQPIYVTKKRRGPMALYALALMWITQLMFMTLRDEDGAVYDNVRFNPRNLLKIDAPVARFVQYINRLAPSLWSEADLPGESVRTLQVVREPDPPPVSDRAAP